MARAAANKKQGAGKGAPKKKVVKKVAKPAAKKHVPKEKLATTVAKPAAKISRITLAKLEHSDWHVRAMALIALRKLQPATLAHYAVIVVGMLEDSDASVRTEALETLAELQPMETLTQYADAILARFEDTAQDSRTPIRACALRH